MCVEAADPNSLFYTTIWRLLSSVFEGLQMYIWSILPLADENNKNWEKPNAFRAFVISLITRADDSRARKAFSGVCDSVCLSVCLSVCECVEFNVPLDT